MLAVQKRSRKDRAACTLARSRDRRARSSQLACCRPTRSTDDYHKKSFWSHFLSCRSFHCFLSHPSNYIGWKHSQSLLRRSKEFSIVGVCSAFRVIENSVSFSFICVLCCWLIVFVQYHHHHLICLRLLIIHPKITCKRVSLGELSSSAQHTIASLYHQLLGKSNP